MTAGEGARQSWSVGELETEKMMLLGCLGSVGEYFL
jgi:hypothetical protein